MRAEKLIWQEPAMGTVKSRLPAVDRLLREFGHLGLGEYLASFPPTGAPGVQPHEDFAEICGDMARSLLGPDIAGRLTEQLRRWPVILTANHLGVDFHPLFVQGNLLFGLACRAAGGDPPVVPVMAFGSVSLGNQVHSRGIILAREAADQEGPDSGQRQLRLNLFSSAMRRTTVSAAPAYSAEMLQGCRDSVSRLHGRGLIRDGERDTLLGLLDGPYRDADVLSRQRYADQATVINHRLWPRLFEPGPDNQRPDMVTLEMEDVAARLIRKDLADPHSLVHRVLFDEDLHRHVIANLDGAYGCWNVRRLSDAVQPDLTGKERDRILTKSGTGFFWSVSPKGRLIRLARVREHGRHMLQGVDEGGRLESHPFTPEYLAAALAKQRLLPSLFTAFLATTFSRAVRCYGGFWQVGYLPIMQDGLVRALAERGFMDWARTVSRTPTANYVTGMIVALADYEGLLRPAGGVEIMAKGGLTAGDLESIRQLNVEEANLFGLVEIIRSFATGQGNSKPLALVHPRQLDTVARKMVRVRL